jgi:thiol-disulfide isomerase/thioredoxin
MTFVPFRDVGRARPRECTGAAARLAALFRFGLPMTACLLVLAASLAHAADGGQAASPPAVLPGPQGAWPEGAAFPDIVLAMPSPDAGWNGGPDVAVPAPLPGEIPARSQLLRLSDLRGQVFIVNLYSWFCAPCQEEAPALRALDARIASAGPGGLAGRVRLVGIAAGDDWNLVQSFRQRHGLVFPLFADPELALHGQLGGLPVPFTWVVRREADGFRVLFTLSGALTGTPAQFLDRVLAAAGPLP